MIYFPLDTWLPFVMFLREFKKSRKIPAQRKTLAAALPIHKTRPQQRDARKKVTLCFNKSWMRFRSMRNGCRIWFGNALDYRRGLVIDGLVHWVTHKTFSVVVVELLQLPRSTRFVSESLTATMSRTQLLISITMLSSWLAELSRDSLGSCLS